MSLILQCDSCGKAEVLTAGQVMTIPTMFPEWKEMSFRQGNGEVHLRHLCGDLHGKQKKEADAVQG